MNKHRVEDLWDNFKWIDRCFNEREWRVQKQTHTGMDD